MSDLIIRTGKRKDKGSKVNDVLQGKYKTINLPYWQFKHLFKDVEL